MDNQGQETGGDMTKHKSNSHFAVLGSAVGDDFKFDDYLQGVIGSHGGFLGFEGLMQGIGPTGLPKNGDDPNSMHPSSPPPLVGPGAY